MALLNFNYGLVKDLPSAIINGNLYVTTDSQGLYVDLEGVRTHVSDFIQVQNLEALQALGTYHTQVFYYVSDSNALMKYTGVEGAEWKQLNSTADLSAALSDLTARVAQNETDIAALETADSQLGARIDGINASNVDTTTKITVTTAVGNYAKGAEIPADTDLQTLILNMLCQDSNPTTTWPKITSVTLTGAGAKEVGSEFTPSYTINTSAGSYVANGVTQETGVSFSNYLGTEVNRPDTVEEASIAANKGTFTKFIVTDNTSYYVTGSADHSAGAIPTTYLGKEYPNGQITAKSLAAVASGKVTGFRPIFWGMSANTDALDSAAIRGLTNTGSAPSARTLTFKAANLAGVKRFLIAIPASSGYKVTKAIITSSMNADATSDYNKIGTVAVEGANGYATTASYDIWAYQPASIASVEVHEVTIGK